MLQFAWAFASCKNVEFREVHPSTRKPKRMKDPSRVVYRELVLSGGVRSRVSPAPGSKRIETRGTALHLVRGHFKDYSGSGLFGRPQLSGTYWWAPHVAGDQNYGTVLKSYVFSPESAGPSAVSMPQNEENPH